MSIVFALDLIHEGKELEILGVNVVKVLPKGIPQKITIDVLNRKNFEILGFLKIELFKETKKILEKEEVILYKPGINTIKHSLPTLDIGEYMLNVLVGIYRYVKSQKIEEKIGKLVKTEEVKKVTSSRRIRILCESI